LKAENNYGKKPAAFLINKDQSKLQSQRETIMGNGNKKKPAAFLDRDGTVIFDRNYLSSPSRVKVYAGAAEAVNKLRKAGFKIIIVTNQSGIGRGMFGKKELDAVNKRFFSLLKEHGAKVDALYYCPHTDEDKCACRKPYPGMALRAAKEHNIDLSKSYAVGDSVRDYLLGFNMGGKGLMVLTGHGKKQSKKIKEEKIKPLAVCATLKRAADFIIKHAGKN
jgi:histidinol-phosphate phosphatase family protein